nr:MAG TPA: hypothetical protein [Caudoviricetes sp.]
MLNFLIRDFKCKQIPRIRRDVVNQIGSGELF